MRPHGKAEVDTSRPAAFAVCDRCGDWYNLETLRWQMEWAGTQLLDIRRLVCWQCIDLPQDQLRTVLIPPDPPPIINARTESFSLDEAPSPKFIGLNFQLSTNSQLFFLFPGWIG